MEIKELMEAYLSVIDEDNKNLVNIAFDEMLSSQYEEATSHFDELYIQDSNNYMSYFFRAYCKSHCGTRGNVYQSSQTLTSAFNLACGKAISANEINTHLYLLIIMYKEAMDNLAYNAVEEVHVDSNGNTSTTNPTKTKINDDCNKNILRLFKENVTTIKSSEELKAYVIDYLNSIFTKTLKRYSINELRELSSIIVAYEPKYAKELETKIKKAKTKSIIASIAFVIAFIVFIIIIK